MKNREEIRTQARENRVREITDRINSAANSGSFDINAEMDYVQSEIIEAELGYTIEDLGKSKRPGMHMYKITWD